VCIIGLRDGFDSTAACCIIDCPGPAAREEPESFTCSVTDPQSCTVSLSWTNPMSYASIQLFADGVLVQTLSGGSVGIELPLPGGVASSELCLVATTTCGETTDPVCCSVSCLTAFQRGDCNIDGHIDIADGIYIMRFLFQNLGLSPCMEACDHNNDGKVDISDTIYVIAYIFLGGPPPGAPFGVCGTDSTPTPGCIAYPLCDD
jgi:hypothetical protein